MSKKALEMRRGVLFDVDGTLSDSSKLGFDATVAVLEKNGHCAITMDDFHQGTQYTTSARFSWHITGDTGDPIGEVLGREFDDMYVELVSKDTAAFYAGIKDMLQDIADAYPHAVYGALSNACGEYVRRVCTANEVGQTFRVQLGADEVHKPKPFPDGLLQCCASINLDPTHCMYIGDSPTDGQAARAANMPSIGVTWGSHAADKVRANFDVTVDTVADLGDAIRRVLETEMPMHVRRTEEHV